MVAANSADSVDSVVNQPQAKFGELTKLEPKTEMTVLVSLGPVEGETDETCTPDL